MTARGPADGVPPQIQGIHDPAIEVACAAYPETGALELRCLFTDQQDPRRQASVVIQIEPAEAIALIDQMIGQLDKLGVKIRPDDSIPGPAGYTESPW